MESACRGQLAARGKSHRKVRPAEGSEQERFAQRSLQVKIRFEQSTTLSRPGPQRRGRSGFQVEFPPGKRLQRDPQGGNARGRGRLEAQPGCEDDRAPDLATDQINRALDLTILAIAARLEATFAAEQEVVVLVDAQPLSLQEDFPPRIMPVRKVNAASRPEDAFTHLGAGFLERSFRPGKHRPGLHGLDRQPISGKRNSPVPPFQASFHQRRSRRGTGSEFYPQEAAVESHPACLRRKPRQIGGRNIQLRTPWLRLVDQRPTTALELS